MKKMSLKDIQEVSLEILQDVHNFCVTNKINYTLAYGTLIGAIRHKGFIPWDDDVDIIMPRADFDRFFKEYKSSKFCSYAPGCNGSLLTFGRVCNNEDTYVKTLSPWCAQETGVWIDIFPYDGQPEDPIEFENELVRLRKSFDVEKQLRRTNYLKLSYNLGIITNVRLLLDKIKYRGMKLEDYVKDHIALAKKYDFDSSNYVGGRCYVGYGKKEFHKRSLFDEYKSIPFEQTELMVCNGYDEILRNIYGDYMQLPPEKDRHPKQTYIKFYFK